MIKGYKIRIYPTKEQEEMIWKHINCCRFMWNYLIDEQKRRYESGEKYASKFDMCKWITPLKKQEGFDWLNEVANSSLQTVCADVDFAYKRFFKKISRYPRYKSKKKSKPSFPLRCDAFYFLDTTVHITKIGNIKYKTDFIMPLGKGNHFYNPRISFVNGKYFLSLCMECENQAPALTENTMGIDLGLKELAVVAYGDEQIVFHNINKSKKMKELEKRIRRTQRVISKKYECGKRLTGSYEKTNNIIKLENKLRKQYAHITNIRHNYIHQITHKLISMRPQKITMEDLNILGLAKNRHKSKAILDACWGVFIDQMKYKCEWNGIQFQQANRFYPSSKTCSCCGNKKVDLKESDRVYICDRCGLRIDRDYNAAINLMRYVA